MQRSTSTPQGGGAVGAAAATPATPLRRPGTSGASPDAKRPAPLSAITVLNGSLMDQGALHAAVCDLQRKFSGFEEWAAILNDSITDHATHLDNNNERLDVIRQGQAAVRAHHEQLGKDVLEVMARVQNNDD